MSICVSDEMLEYVRTLFEHPSKYYESYQENGTKYLKSLRKLDDQLQQRLNACAGEIFLCGIPPETQSEKIAEIAALVGEVYILRFKVHFSGASRGFAYLQYIDPHVMQLALKRLPLLFAKFRLQSIKVCTSRNSSMLLLRKTSKMSPKTVYELLCKIISFNNLVGYEMSPGYFEYKIAFNCNEEAVHARREILKSIFQFGPKAIIIWDASCRGSNYFLKTTKELPYQENRRGEMKALQRPTVNIFHQNYISRNNSTFVNDFANMSLC